MMGAQLVSRVFVYWSDLPDRPFRLLVHMALTVKDATKEPTYWGGRDALAQALGLEPGEAAYQSVKRALRQITEAGAARIGVHGHAGRRTEYVLTLDREGVTERPARGSVNDPLSGSVNDPQRGSLSDPSGGHPPTPLGTTEDAQRNTAGDKSPLKVIVSSRLAARVEESHSRRAGA